MKHKLMLGLFLLTLTAGGVDAFVCHDSDVIFDEDIIREVADITIDSPSNQSVLYSDGNTPTTFTLTSSVCSVVGAPTTYRTIGFRLNATKTNGVLYSNNTHYILNENNVNATKTISLTLPVGTYNISVDTKVKNPVLICLPEEECPFFLYSQPTPPNLLTLTNNFNTGSNTGGACLTEYGLFYTYSAASDEDYVLFDLSGMSHYCVDTDCNNTFILGDDYYVYNDYQIVANTTFYKPLTLYIGGFNYNFNHTRRNPTPDQTITLNPTNFTSQNKNYFLTYKNETNNNLLDLNGMNSLQLKTFCNDYSPDTIDVQTLGTTNLFLTVKERPQFEHIQDSFFNRIFEPYLDSQNISIYLPMNTTAYETIQYQLQDYTGQFYNSYLQIIKNVNGTLVTLYQKQWYNTLIEGVDLVNETDYQYVLYTPTATRIIKWDYITSTGERIITVTDPTYTETPNYQTGVTVGFTSSYSSSSIGLIYNITDNNAGNLTLKIYNYTNNNYQVMDTTTVENPNSGTITVTVPNQNHTYWVTAECSHNNYGIIKLGDYIRPSKTEAMYPRYGSWNLPSTILGVELDSWYTGASVFLMSAAAFTVSGGIGGLVTVGVIGVTKWMGWFREMTWGLWGFLAAMSLMYAFVEKRRKTE